mmetsp:Transcript_46306/g.89156  ORF Transcript_46306/g.89156 Transcript_46306/m.89156 type:complete len:317 (-) Transcript_46306:99-1049(-)
MATAVIDPVSVPTGIGTREIIDLANPVLNLQKIESPQASIHACAQRYGSQAVRSIFEKLAEREEAAAFEVIDLSDNNIGDAGIAHLSEGLAGNANLKKLILPRARFGAGGFKALGGLLAATPNLKELVASSNICDAEGISGEFCFGLSENTSLQSLVISACRIGDAGAAALLKGPLKRHPSLEHVSLSYNRLESAVAASVNEMLAANKVLRFLDLKGNSLGPAGAEALLKGLEANGGNLQKLGLAQNCIRLQGARALSKHFMSPQGATLDYLDLRHNNVTYYGLCDLRNGILGRPMDGPEGWMLLYGARQLLLNAH